MKGNLKKTEEGWFVIYDQRTMQDPSAEDGMLPLHPEYQTILPLDLDLDGKEIEFEINMYDGKSHISNAWNGYAKLIDKEEPCCTPEGQIKRYVDCIGCDKKPYPVSEDYEKQKNTELSAEEYLKENSDWFDKSPGGEKLYFESEVIKMMKNYSSQIEISDEEIEMLAWENPCLSRQDIYELFDEVFKDKTVQGIFKISVSKEVRQFKERLRQLAKQKYREQFKNKL